MEEKIEGILRQAYQVFLQYGLKNVSMDDICRELGISKKTLYQYVENKADLVEKLLDYHIRMQCEKTQCMVKEDMNAIDVLLEMSKAVSDGLKNLQPGLIFELQKYYPSIFRSFMEYKRETILQYARQNMEQGIREGLYRDDLQVELVALLYIKKLEEIHNPDFLEAARTSAEKVFEVMFENHIRGIANEKGIAYFESKQKQLKNSE